MEVQVPIENRIVAIKKEFGELETWEDKYRRVIEYGKAMPPMNPLDRTEESKVKGCQSQVWLHAKLQQGGVITFWGESDALIVNGLLAILVKIYDQSTPDEILRTSPDFLKEIGFSENLSPSRANGLMAMTKQIVNFAQGFKIILQMKQ
jgi:cysteine desulfuration protein SufE